MHRPLFTLERTLELPGDAPAKLVEDIEGYNALVELQSTMTGRDAWYARLS